VYRRGEHKSRPYALKTALARGKFQGGFEQRFAGGFGGIQDGTPNARRGASPKRGYFTRGLEGA
jgi:hypothetical protein